MAGLLYELWSVHRLQHTNDRGRAVNWWCSQACWREHLRNLGGGNGCQPAETALNCEWAGEVNWPTGLLQAGGNHCTDTRQFASGLCWIQASVNNTDGSCIDRVLVVVKHVMHLSSSHAAFDFWVTETSSKRCLMLSDLDCMMLLPGKLSCLQWTASGDAGILSTATMALGITCLFQQPPYGTKARRYNWHSAGSLGWPFPIGPTKI